jgi:hypothetical protein
MGHEEKQQRRAALRRRRELQNFKNSLSCLIDIRFLDGFM